MFLEILSITTNRLIDHYFLLGQTSRKLFFAGTDLLTIFCWEQHVKNLFCWDRHIDNIFLLGRGQFFWQGPTTWQCFLLGHSHVDISLLAQTRQHF